MAQTLDISKAPDPWADESVEHYCVRAHKALLKEIPSAEERNQIIWQAWREHKGETPEEKIAAEKFAADRYARSNGHCSFVEHKTVGKDGQKKEIGLKNLAAIVRQHNAEIRDLAHFPALTDGHTPDEQGGKEPAVVGHAGPFRLGMVGNENPRFAIFQDEHHRLDSADVLSRKPFRSPELWTFKATGIQRFHPIAIVGADAPRLQMPAKYTADHEAQECGRFQEFEYEGADVERYTINAVCADVEKYDAGCGAMAGGSNTFVKGQRDDYSAAGTTPPDQLRDLMAMILETPQFRYLTKKMEEEEALAGAGPGEGQMPGMPDQAGQMEPADGLGADEGLNDLGGDVAGNLSGGPEDDTDLEDDGDLPSGPPDTSDLDDLTGESLAGKSKETNSPTPPKDKKGASKEKHSMASNPNIVTVEKYTELADKHSELEKYTEKLKTAHEELIGDHKKLLDRVGAIERTSADSARKAQLEGLAEKYTAINLDDECKKCLYSQGSSMSDEAFVERVKMITEIGESFVNSPMIPRGSLPERYTERRSADIEKYEQRLAEEAINYHTEQMALGQNVPYDTCKAEAKKRLAASNGHAAATA